jgi:hypothetical protein
MLPSTHPPLLELQTQLWKARAQAKQKWLERSLQEPTDDPSETARRALWVKRALEAVKRAQATMKYNAALVDAYSEHLSVLEMTLMSAAERQLVTSNGKPEKQRE